MGDDDVLDVENVVVSESSVVDDNGVLLGDEKYVVSKLPLVVDDGRVPAN